MKFPLYHRLSAVVFLDDETPYLEMLAMVLPQDWPIRFYTRMDDFLAQMNHDTQLWEDDVALHQSMVNQWYAGKSLPSMVMDYWRSSARRHGLTNIAVVDYAMPAANGLEVLKVSPAWPMYRVLLTGKADEYTAVAAFNDGLIDRFVTKQTPDLVQRLTQVMGQLQHASLDMHDGIWRNILRRGQLMALQDRAVQLELKNWVKTNDCVEYVVLTEPFGLLALDSTGMAHWLQFEMHKDISHAVELAKVAGLDAQTLEGLAQGQLLTDLEWTHALGSTAAPQAAPAMAWGTGGHLIAAHFPQHALGTIGLSHRAFLDNQPERGVDLGEHPRSGRQ